jgi:hypothetical protein
MSDRQREKFLMKEKLLFLGGNGDEEYWTSVSLSIQVFQHATDGNQTCITRDEQQFAVSVRWKQKTSIGTREYELVAGLRQEEVIGAQSFRYSVKDQD